MLMPQDYGRNAVYDSRVGNLFSPKLTGRYLSTKKGGQPPPLKLPKIEEIKKKDQTAKDLNALVLDTPKSIDSINMNEIEEVHKKPS